MGTISEKLTYTANAVETIKNAVVEKNPDFNPNCELLDVAQGILDISGGGGDTKIINYFDWKLSVLGNSGARSSMSDFEYFELNNNLEDYDLLVFIVGNFPQQDHSEDFLYDRLQNQGILAIIPSERFYKYSLADPIVAFNSNINASNVGNTFNIKIAFKSMTSVFWKNEGSVNRAIAVLGLSKKKNERHDTILARTQISDTSKYITGQKFNFNPMDYDVLLFETEQSGVMYYNGSAPMLSSSMYVTPQTKQNPVRITIDSEKIVSVNYSGSYMNTYLTIRGIKYNSASPAMLSEE